MKRSVNVEEAFRKPIRFCNVAAIDGSRKRILATGLADGLHKPYKGIARTATH